ncbi:hypothetical protein [Saccharothrix coeruleofusca]|uniref:DUF4383 domain-containing protein n=1 Tax=Saccharothrix coeruleofusca TaxID=33919 RepID=A0A918AQV5_9PSEU|nr:hypothetical protein [Saccharothrix coeruleofusca]MBP2338009.1 hypothetical protein [Saccharothrix coeruleofusca]GGP63724.1 hypothetical protein GCM10010185_40540 [Saccharothrix coeruleofusca]
MTGLSWPQRAALCLGVLLTAWGLADTVWLGGTALGVFHLVTGVLVGLSAVRTKIARGMGVLMGVVFLSTFALGASESGSVLDAGVLGNVLHLLAGFAFVAVAESCAWCALRDRPTGNRTHHRLS